MDYMRAKQFLDTLPDWESGRPHMGPLDDYLPRMRALLRRLGDPQCQFRSVIVGGTNGKGTVSSLLAELANGAGLRAGLYTSPHLHSLRERIQVGGHNLSKDHWARGITQLFDCSRGFDSEGYGPFSKFEALTALATLLFAEADVECAIFEVGLGGTYDATNAWDSEAAVLTSIGLDHTEALGDDLIGIAEQKLAIGRRGSPLFTTSGQPTEVLTHVRSRCESLGILLHVSDPTQSQWSQRRRGANAPCTFVENAQLALKTAQHLFEGRLAVETALEIVDSWEWPGRFEQASHEPCVILDGAHNPAAAHALAEDLGAIASRWTFIIGVSDGHDAAGILQALRPLARHFVLASSDHPRAMGPQQLGRVAPRGIATTTFDSYEQAFVATREGASSTDHICVTGSLALVARAREYFGLPFQREGISEDVALESLACVEAACERAQVECERVSENDNVLKVKSGRSHVYFLRNKHPFNDYVAARLAEDKGYQYELFAREGLPVPFTMQVFNPYADDRFNRYKRHHSVDEIVEDVDRHMKYPIFIKKYRSSVSQGVYVERSGDAVKSRLQSLFENSGFVDNTVLAQAFVVGREFRAVASQADLLLAYEKQSDREDGTREDPNPLHEPSGRAVRIEDPDLLEAMAELTSRIARVIDLGFYAIDLIGGPDGLSILELNPNPFCYFYNRSNGRADFVKIYELLLSKYIKKQ